jgi:type II secretory pathway component PulM
VSGWLARLRAWFDGLARREKLLVAAAGCITALVLVWALAVAPLLGARSRSIARAEAAQQQADAVRALRGRYDEVAGRLAGVEQRIQSGPQANLLATLESLAQQSAVKVDSMEPRTAPAGEQYRETKMQVTLENATLPQVVAYLHKIESAPQLLSVKSLRVRTRSDTPELLEVTFSVSSFERI